MDSTETAEAYIEAYEAGRVAAQTKRSILFRVIKGVALLSMAAAVALSLLLVAEAFGIYPI